MDTFLFEMSMKWIFTFKNFRNVYWHGKQHSALAQLLYYQDVRFDCKIPCTRNKYSTRLLHNEPISGKKLRIVFAKTVNVDRSVYSIDSQTFLTRLGGSVSTGRTLLWILLTLLGAFQVNPLVIFSTWKILILRFCAFYVSELFSGDKQTSGAKSFLK